MGFVILGILGFGTEGRFTDILLTRALLILNLIIIMTLSFHHILVPYDGTKTGNKAFKAAIQIAEKFDAEVMILSCIEREPTFVFFETRADKRQIKTRIKKMQEKVDQLKLVADEFGIKIRTKVTDCNLASKYIVSYAKAHEVDLIVMSKSSTINPEKIYHESTVNYVYRNVSCPMFNL